MANAAPHIAFLGCESVSILRALHLLDPVFDISNVWHALGRGRSRQWRRRQRRHHFRVASGLGSPAPKTTSAARRAAFSRCVIFLGTAVANYWILFIDILAMRGMSSLVFSDTIGVIVVSGTVSTIHCFVFY